MRSLLIVAALLATGAAQAAPTAPPAAPPPSPPRVFQQAGYTEPEIGPAACKAVNAGETQCAIPAMTAGVYLVQATGTSTAQAPDAAQQLTIVAATRAAPAPAARTRRRRGRWARNAPSPAAASSPSSPTGPWR